MTDRFKEAFDWCAKMRVLADSILADSCFTAPLDTIEQALTLATESEQLRTENSMLKQVNELLRLEGRKIPIRMDRESTILQDGTLHTTQYVYVGDEAVEQLRKERDELAAFIRQKHDVLEVPTEIFNLCIQNR